MFATVWKRTRGKAKARGERSFNTHSRERQREREKDRRKQEEYAQMNEKRERDAFRICGSDSRGDMKEG